MRHKPETYWAIRVGSAPKHSPYFLLHYLTKTPAIFDSKNDAQEHLRSITGNEGMKVIRVKLKAG